MVIMAKNGQLKNSLINSQSLAENDTYVLQPDFSLEEERVKTFTTWPVQSPVDPTRLAKAGFYYSGKDDEVICFSCLGHIKDWNYGDIVQKKHSELFPNCNFVNGKSKNIPITKTQKADMIQQLSTSLSGTQFYALMRTIDYEKMKSKTERVKSFDNDILLESCFSTEDFAEAGFFFLGIEDKLQCAFCEGIISACKCDNEPIIEHQKLFPWCKYLQENKKRNVPEEKNVSKEKNVSEEGNVSEERNICKERNVSEERKIPLETEDDKLIALNKLWQDYLDIMSRPKNKFSVIDESVCDHFWETHKTVSKDKIYTNLIKLGIQPYASPAYPEKASLSARLLTFSSWPDTCPIYKEELAEAGFFYTGNGDQTKCFHCGGGLCNWEPNDDAWTEHARWFCNCPFLRLHIDDEFINSCFESVSSTCKEPTDRHFPSELLIIKLDEAMKSDMVKNCLDSGLFSHYLIRAAILLQMKETGSMFTDMDEMCLAVTRLKEEMEKSPFDSHTDSGLEANNVDIRCTSKKKKKNINADKVKKDEIVDSGPIADQCLCKICMDKEVGIAFLPCGHLLACTECATSVSWCPMCRKVIKATVRVYLP